MFTQSLSSLRSQTPRNQTVFAFTAALLLSATPLLSASGCAGKPTQKSSSGAGATGSDSGNPYREWVGPTPATALTREMAYRRSKLLSDVTYRLRFQFPEKTETFTGSVAISFTLKKGGDSAPLPLDFQGGKLTSLTLNSAAASASEQKSRPEWLDSAYDGSRVMIPMSQLKEGRNTLEIGFTHPFSTGPSGLVRVQDATDGTTYIYSILEGYHAHEVFPCFNQLDLKARFELTVEAPQAWTVISTQRETGSHAIPSSATGSRLKIWNFPETFPLSPDSLALHAGPFAQWNSASSPVPQRLFARRSVAAFVNAAAWFKNASHGIEFLSARLGQNFPHRKYDQLLVPEIVGASTHAAAAPLFSERFILRGGVMDDTLTERAFTSIRHVAQAWMGDSATPRWWNGLWIKESFSTYAAIWALNEKNPTAAATSQPEEKSQTKGEAPEAAPETSAGASDDLPYQDAWHFFFSNFKLAAYELDQKSTALPLEFSVPGTHVLPARTPLTQTSLGSAQGAAKGAAVFRQLVETIGEEEFRDGIQRFLQRFSQRNFTWADLERHLDQASGSDLKRWSRYWLSSAGLNQVNVNVTCSAEPESPAIASDAASETSVIESLKLQQADLRGRGILRPHRLKLLLINWKKAASGEVLWETELLSQSYEGAQTSVSAAVGKPCPDLILTNSDDADYALPHLDDSSLRNWRKGEKLSPSDALLGLPNPLLRHWLWRAYWQSVLEQKTTPQEWLEFTLKTLPQETDARILTDMLGLLVGREQRDLTGDFAGDTARSIGIVYYLPEGQRAQTRARLEKFINDTTYEQTQGLRKSLSKSDPAKSNLELLPDAATDVELAWLEAQRLLARRARAAMTSPSETESRWKTIIQALTSIEASAPVFEARRELAELSAQLNGHYFGTAQTAPARAEATSKFFETLEALTRLPRSQELRDDRLAGAFVRGLYPRSCGAQNLSKAEALLQGEGTLSPLQSPAARKALREILDDEVRCLVIQKQESRADSASTNSGKR